MPRCIAPDDSLLGVMGLDLTCPSPRRRCCAGSPAHRLRQARNFCKAHLPAALTLARQGDLLVNSLTPEGIGIGVLRHHLRQLPPPQTMLAARSAGASAQTRDAWGACRHSFGIKAARYVADHGLRYNSHNPNHILALRDALLGVVGPVRSARQAHRAIAKALLALEPSLDLQRGLQGLDTRARRGRQDLLDTLRALREVLRHERYCRVLFHSDIGHWGEFAGFWQKACLALLLAGLAAALCLSQVFLALVVSSSLAFFTNEIRLLLRDACADEVPSSAGVRGWLLATRYTGRCAF